jgi:hypothetical protein
VSKTDLLCKACKEGGKGIPHTISILIPTSMSLKGEC